jgi:hypothetical protein
LKRSNRPKSEVSSASEVNRTSGGVTIVKLGGGGYTRRAKLGDSRSTGRLHAAPHRSITRLNLAGQYCAPRAASIRAAVQ